MPARRCPAPQTRVAVHPNQARPAATTQAIQLAHTGIMLSAIVIGHPARARINCSRATTANTVAARRE